MASTKKNLSRKSINAIRRMIAAVLAEPKYLDQRFFPSSNDCGRVCCGAGWAVFLRLGKKRYEKLVAGEGNRHWSFDWDKEGAAALHLPSSTPLNPLFGTTMDWPSKFYVQYRDAKGPKGRAKAFAARWEAFIKSDGNVNAE